MFTDFDFDWLMRNSGHPRPGRITNFWRSVPLAPVLPLNNDVMTRCHVKSIAQANIAYGDGDAGGLATGDGGDVGTLAGGGDVGTLAGAGGNADVGALAGGDGDVGTLDAGDGGDVGTLLAGDVGTLLAGDGDVGTLAGYGVDSVHRRIDGG